MVVNSQKCGRLCVWVKMDLGFNIKIRKQFTGNLKVPETTVRRGNSIKLWDVNPRTTLAEQLPVEKMLREFL